MDVGFLRGAYAFAWVASFGPFSGVTSVFRPFQLRDAGQRRDVQVFIIKFALSVTCFIGGVTDAGLGEPALQVCKSVDTNLACTPTRSSQPLITCCPTKLQSKSNPVRIPHPHLNSSS